MRMWLRYHLCLICDCYTCTYELHVAALQCPGTASRQGDTTGPVFVTCGNGPRWVRSFRQEAQCQMDERITLAAGPCRYPCLRLYPSGRQLIGQRRSCVPGRSRSECHPRLPYMLLLPPLSVPCNQPTARVRTPTSIRALQLCHDVHGRSGPRLLRRIRPAAHRPPTAISSPTPILTPLPAGC